MRTLSALLQPMTGAVYKGFRMINKSGPPSLAACHTENIDIHLMLRDELIAQGRNDFRRLE